MFKLLKRKIICLFVTVMLCVNILPVTVYATDNFSDSIKSEFYNFILWAKREDYRGYSTFAIHDLDGDAIPEVLFGLRNESNSKFSTYDVVKYYKKDFKKIGKIAESRYLMKDKYSASLLALYGEKSGTTTEINNYYIHNSTLQKNSVLKLTSQGVATQNNVSITRSEYNTELYNYLGSYDELMVHDSFNTSVVLSAIYTWKPVVYASPYASKLKSNITLTKDWQIKYNEFIEAMKGPVDTFYQPYEDEVPRGAAKYSRFAIHDLNGDGLPELLAGVTRGDLFSFDVYKYINREVTFIGSIDSYSRYLGKMSGSNDIFCYNPIPNMFANQSVYRISFKNNAFDKSTLMSIYPSASNPSTIIYEVGNARSSLSGFNNKLISYIKSNTEIKTYDVDLVPQDAVVYSWRPFR